MNQRIEDEDIRIKPELDRHALQGSPFVESSELGGDFDGEREGVFVGSVKATMEHEGEEEKAVSGVGAGGVGADESVPGVEIWVGDLVEHEAGVVEACAGREG